MVVCVEGELGFFFRINTKAGWQQSVPLKKSPDHPFLDHDSHLECGDPLELDDYVIEQSPNRKGVIGAVSPSLIPDILRAVKAAARMTEKDKEKVIAFLDPTGEHRAERPNPDDP
jgi:hypothetical protein